MNKSGLTKAAEICTILSLIRIGLAVYQLYQKKNDDLINLRNERIHYDIEILFPIWAEWKSLFYDAQKLTKYDGDYMARLHIAQDKWNLSTNIFMAAETKINIFDKVNSLMENQDYEKIADTIDEILEGTMLKEIRKVTDSTRQIRNHIYSN